MRRELALLLVAGISLALAACASTGSNGGNQEAGRDVITRSEIQQTDVPNLYELVKRRRPTWLRTRTVSYTKDVEIVVVRDGTVIGNVETLRQIGRDGITELRFMDGETAAATLVGARSGYVAGAIIIERGSGS